MPDHCRHVVRRLGECRSIAGMGREATMLRRTMARYGAHKMESRESRWLPNDVLFPPVNGVTATCLCMGGGDHHIGNAGTAGAVRSLWPRRRQVRLLNCS